MLDSSFNKEYKDLKNELEGHGTVLEVKLMNNNDAIQQHERFIFDDVIAYKIPPMNIINKKSEHIVKIGRRDRYKSITYPQDNGSFRIEKGRLRIARLSGTIKIDLTLQ